MKMNLKTNACSRAAKYFLYLTLLFCPLARGSVHPWQQSIMITGILIAFLFLLFEQFVYGTSRKLFCVTAFDKPIIVLLFLCICSLIQSHSVPDSLEALSLLIAYILFFYITVNLLRTRKDQREFVYVLVAISFLVAIISYTKAGELQLATPWMYTDLAGSKVFLSGPFGNHNHLAGYLEMTIPLLLSLFLTRTKRGNERILMFTILFTLVVCHILALSRGGWFALGGAMLFMAAVLFSRRQFKRKKLLFGIFLVCVVLIFFVLSGSSLFQRALSLTDRETILGLNGRMMAWKGTWMLIKDSPFLGIGPGTFSTVFPQYQLPGFAARFFQAHNDYLQFIAELGAFFIIWFFWAIYIVFKVGFEKMKSNSRQKWGFTLGAITGIVAVLIHSIVDFNLHIPANALSFTFLLALIAGEPEIKKPQ